MYYCRVTSLVHFFFVFSLYCGVRFGTLASTGPSYASCTGGFDCYRVFGGILKECCISRWSQKESIGSAYFSSKITLSVTALSKHSSHYKKWKLKFYHILAIAPLLLLRIVDCSERYSIFSEGKPDPEIIGSMEKSHRI
jgi:hypothetical protein